MSHTSIGFLITGLAVGLSAFVALPLMLWADKRWSDTVVERASAAVCVVLIFGLGLLALALV